MLYSLDISSLVFISNRIHSLKYIRSTTKGCKEFVAKTQILWWILITWNLRYRTLKVSNP